jgi:hypothetical protein
MDDLMAFRAAMSNERVAPAPAVVAVVRRRRRNGRVVNMVVVKLEGVLWGGFVFAIRVAAELVFRRLHFYQIPATRFRRPDSGENPTL